MKKNFHILTFVLAFLPSFFIAAQQEQSLNFLTDTWQAHLTNPALLPSKKWSVALPSFYFNVNSPDLVVGDLIVTENGSRNLYLSKLYAPERPTTTQINAHLQMQTLGVAIPVTKNLNLSVYHASTATPSVTYRRDLAQLFFKGNSDFLGKTVSFGSSANASLRSEIGIGATYQLPILTIGARVKLHSGIAGIFTQKDKLDISFNQTDYSLRFDNDFAFTTYDANKITNFRKAQDLVNQGFLSQNNGISFDLGGSMKLGKIQVNASLLDIGGAISWKSDSKYYASQGVYTYKGKDLNSFDQFFKIDSLSSESFVDTLKKVIGLQEGSGSYGYKQKLPMRLYLSGSYQVNDKLSLGALIYNENGGDLDKANTGFAINASYNVVDLGKILKIRTGLTYGLRNGSFNNLGAHITVNALKIIQVFAVTDNLLTVFKPYDSNNANGRVGMGLIF
ncbi:MAG: hypothetical protein JNL70_25255 [Saprospiraceae bacterium]|nr:hypothetical protein [Saprospiraceae bacterium]